MVGVKVLVEARKLTVGHGRQPILSGIDLRVVPGRVLCLLGPNGAGKTTLFRTLLGLLQPLGGELMLGGQPLDALTRREIANRLAHVPQGLAAPFAWRARDLVLMGAATRLGAFARPGPEEEQAALAALDSVGIADLADAEVTRLSGGQRQMVLIARAIAQGAAAIAMDEPTASLDFANRIRVGRTIRNLADRGIGVILSTHDPDQAASLGDDALLVGNGGVFASGPANQTLTAGTLSRLYGIAVEGERLSDGTLHFRG